MERITLKVEGMMCGHCKAAVEKALRSTAGVQDAEADLASKAVTVSYDPGEAGRGDLVKAIANSGYSVVE
ncbi:MAG: heavy-metal-associated domain-containing protein [Eubacteriales bacterium]